MHELLRNGEPAQAATLLCQIDFEALSDQAQTQDYLMLVREIRNDYQLVRRFADSMNWTENEFTTLKIFEDVAVHQVSDHNWLLNKLKSHIKRFPRSVAINALLLDDLATTLKSDAIYLLSHLVLDGRFTPEIESTYLRNRILSQNKHSRLSHAAFPSDNSFHELLSAQQFWQMEASINLQERNYVELLKSCSTALSLPRGNWWEKFRGNTAGFSPNEIAGVQYYVMYYRGGLYALSWRLRWPFLCLPKLNYPFIGFLDVGRWLIEALHFVVDKTKPLAGKADSLFFILRKKILRHGILRGQDLRSLALQLHKKTHDER